ncbi:phenylacetic acid degradation protein [Meiothermus hypogaeus]|uniref:Phenylacetic acid degradation protein n=2 Tax=Meiothermus hypogaeus TaxID=884155 RepID=A0A511R6C5_9DEIN|nr:phenylacetic acid degradation protein [Meiothermus hypogaeus]RIH80263.1 1,2-phenylacetyl-CoA epoxidase, subunit B [Meiothermus hypogaeus]GEM85163.1 hypothetical protein MHY01S_33290 [Meiothermus hypogaeus NBRC 106114]GIW37541.1 MAG: hypothetical protein KatS3mg073_1686 [Meiothermus sp.]
MDTQWPRWEVFKQDSPNKPHQAVGSVHAADPEHALLTARNIFARRPQAVSMWVVRAEDIYSWTQEEVAEGQMTKGESYQAQVGQYLVFRKTSHKRSMTFVDYVGEVEAATPEEALKKAQATFTDALALAWWIVPADRVYKSDPSPETIQSWFAPAKDKTYKQQQYYATVGSHISKHKVGRGVEDEE